MWRAGPLSPGAPSLSWPSQLLLSLPTLSPRVVRIGPPHASPLLSSITLSVSKAKNKEVKEQISKGRGARGSAKRKMTDRAQHGLPSGPYSRHCVAPETAWWDPKALCVSTEPGIEWAHNQVCTLQLRKVFIHHNCVLPQLYPLTHKET